MNRKATCLVIPRQTFFLILVSALIGLQLIGLAISAYANAPHIAAPDISNVRLLTPSVAEYEKVQVEFDVTTSATHLDLPFDAAPPEGLDAGMGVSVDALLSADNWKTTITQPAFFYQPFTYRAITYLDHFTPDGAPFWMVRFTPRQTGNWQMRLRVQDKGGTRMYPTEGALSFHVYAIEDGRYNGLRENPYTRHGFLRVSGNDPRYFEFEDGTPFIGLGYNAGSYSVPNVQNRYRLWQENGLQFARVWMSSAGINGSQWTPWAFPQQQMNFGLPTTLLDRQIAFPGSDFSMRLNTQFPCMFADFWQGGIPVEPSTTYSVTVRARTENVTPRVNAASAGFTMVRDGWVNPKDCSTLKTAPLMPYRVGTSDWFTETGTLQTGPGEEFLNFLYLALQNVQDGTAYIDAVSLVRSDDPAGVNVLKDGRADSHLYFDDMSAAKWDLLIEQAEQHGVYLKIVADEKNEWIRNVIQSDGTQGKFGNDNFYAAKDTKVRWLDEAWWRYLIARWGYSTAIHSFEFVNEGDPYNGNHYDAANAMARYFDEHDPSQHMVTTSFWHSFPNKEFWSNPRDQAIDYADVHAYITTGWGNNAAFIPNANLDTRPENQYQGANSFHVRAAQGVRDAISPRGVTLNEKGEWLIRYWMKQDSFKAKCGYGEGGSSARVYWELDNKRQGVVPGNLQGKNFYCTSPDGTFDWREFDSQHDRDGKELAITQRLVLTDTVAHDLTIGIQNVNGVSGDAWISNVELISPSGKRVPVLGTFEGAAFTDDSAWWTAAYSLLWGGASPVGAHKPLVRGESAINSKEFPNGLPGLNEDTEGIWLHNFVWGQINPGGMYDLWWYATQNIEDNKESGRTGNLYGVFEPYYAFMRDVPLNNGLYHDAEATTLDPRLRVWGQRDETNGRAHLWIQNPGHVWSNVVAGKAATPLEGTIQLAMPPGRYRVEWWDPYRTRDPIFKTETVTVKSGLMLTLPARLESDVAVKIERFD